MCNLLGVFGPFGPRVGGLYVSSCLHWYCIYHANNWEICVICWVSQLVRAKTWCPCSAMVWLEVKILRKISIIFRKKKSISNLFRPAFIFLYMVSNWLRCQICPGVKLTLLHSWCQIGPVSNWCRCQIDSFTLLVSNWYRCQIDSFALLVSNCPPHTLVSNWCRSQIVLQPSLLTSSSNIHFY